MSFCRWVFRISAIYGVIVLVPLYFLESKISADNASILHPEYFYGFIGTALSAQILFFVISQDPVGLRRAIPACVAEKLAFAIPVWLLWSASRVGQDLLLFGSIDLLWAALFTLSYFRLGRTVAATRITESA
jgi:hypothetical protein